MSRRRSCPGEWCCGWCVWFSSCVPLLTPLNWWLYVTPPIPPRTKKPQPPVAPPAPFCNSTTCPHTNRPAPPTPPTPPPAPTPAPAPTPVRSWECHAKVDNAQCACTHMHTLSCTLACTHCHALTRMHSLARTPSHAHPLMHLLANRPRPPPLLLPLLLLDDHQQHNGSQSPSR
jgi:hypothetical protein